MENCKPASTPIAQGEKLTNNEDAEKVDETSYRSLVGCLLYLRASRPNIIFAVSILSRFIHYCNVNHYKVAKRVLRYIRVKFVKAEKVKLLGHEEYLRLFLYSRIECVLLELDEQETVAQSTAEVQYVATAASCDNQSAVAIAKNPVFHRRTKHFKIKYHFVREVEQAKEVTLLADILTKPLGKLRFEKLHYDIGDRNMEAKKECFKMTIYAKANPEHKFVSSPNV
ncbi:laccase-2-like [Gossypium australe]|uniref:Laccase-2-like n=1 Tax=Gossypium australe TaxID=47621 RepID=A0A5B6V9A9_9ROSI|nr:laccase-2-like [Gossypium australe]